MRPRGSYGEVGRALIDQAKKQPGTVRELAQRAQVGYVTAAKTASRFVQAGELVKLNEGRPAVLALPDQGSQPEGNVFLLLSPSLWRREAAADGA